MKAKCLTTRTMRLHITLTAVIIHIINGVGDNSQEKTNEKNIYNEMIITQRELIDSLKEQITQYRKEIEYLRQIIKECNENNGK